MTQIGPVTIHSPASYRRRDYNVVMYGKVDDSLTFNELRELFAKAPNGTAIHAIPGARPYGEDLTESGRNTQYCQFTHGNKPQTGYYLLRSFNFVEDITPQGRVYIFTVRLFFLGTKGYYQNSYRIKNQEDEDNDWDL